MPLSKRNRRGLFWLLTVCLLISIAPRVFNEIYALEMPDISQEELLSIHNEMAAAEEKREEKSSEDKVVRYHVPPNKFDPNDYTIEDWVSLGMSEKQAEVVVKFAKRGLKSNDDLKRVFVFPAELFDLVKDSTFYPAKEDKPKWEKEEKLMEPVNLNTANQEVLETIPGIGPYYAAKILEYRNKLGGYIGKEQLLELWKFDNEKLLEIDEYIFVGTISLEKLNINEAPVEELKNHPYIDYSVANSIVKMRLHNPYVEISDIKRSKLIDEELFKKLKPYLRTQ